MPDKFYMPLHLAIESSFIDLEMKLQGNLDVAVPYLCGLPGAGKTAMVREECKKRDWNLFHKNCALVLFEELSGIPEVCKSANGELYTQWTKPQIVEELERLASEKPTLCFFDDWHRTNASVQSLGFEAFTDYSIKGYKLPRNVVFMLCGNDSVMAGMREALSAVLNRVSKKYIKTDYDYWKQHFALKNINPLILGFLDASENRKFFHMEESTYEPWASPRSWTYLSSKINAMESTGAADRIPNHELVAEFSSYVGTEAASKLISHWLYYRTVNVDQIFKTGNYTIPKTLQDQYIFSYAVSNELVNRWKNQNLQDRSGQIFAKILNDLYKVSREAGAILLSNVSIRNSEITNSLTKSGLISSQLLNSLQNLTTNMGKLENKV